MRIFKIEDKNRLDDFFKKNGVSMLQSWEWGEFQKMMGRKVWRIGLEESGELVVSALIVKMNLNKNLSYLYMPRGPVFEGRKDTRYKQIPNFKFQILKLFEKIRMIVNEERVMFLRVDPEWEEDEKSVGILKDFGFVKARKEIQPKDTWILDLDKDEEELLKEMHCKTRYNIRLAKRKNIKVSRYSEIEKSDLEKFEEFWKIMGKTAARDKFGLHPKDYYKKQLKVLGSQNLVNLFLAEFDGKIVGGIIVSFFGRQAVYMHGALDYEYRKYMASYLLQWEAILEAKRRGCHVYDFWGIKNQKSKIKNQKWEGLSRFKQGFGGREVNYIGAWDLIYKKAWYTLYNFVGKVKG